MPPPMLAFLMGALHGLNFVILLAICRRALAHVDSAGLHRTALLLALAGCLSANFLSELGNTMGDNTTSILCLASLAVVLRGWDRIRSGEGARILVAAGAIAGLAAGLKLTNAVHAIALASAFLFVPMAGRFRMRAAAIFAVGALAGAAVTGGYWHYEMWRSFGNPLFPQFASVFPNALAAPVSVADQRWHPQSWAERVAWPFLISLDARRAGPLPLRQIVWAVVYAMYLLLAATWLLRKRSGTARQAIDPMSAYLIAFVGIGFIVWMFVFGIYRYLVALELVAPLVVYLVAKHCLPAASASRVAWGLLAACAAVVATGGVRMWGHADFSDKPFEVDLPPLTEASRTTVFLVGGDPWAWLALAMPRDVALIQAGGNFPEGPAFKPRVREIVTQRAGSVFAVVTGRRDPQVERARKLAGLLDSIGVTTSERGCSLGAAAFRLLQRRFELVARAGGGCELRSLRPLLDIPAENRAERAKASDTLRAYGFQLDERSCTERAARLAGRTFMFQWCAVRHPSESSS